MNRRYKPPLGTWQVPKLPEVDNARGEMSEKHLKMDWSREEIDEAVRQNVVGMNWNNNATRSEVPLIVRSQGVYLYDADGKEYMDMTSQAVCANVGYSIDENVVNAVVKQMRTNPYVYPGFAQCEIRARLASLLADITPADINGFVFPLSGSEANEIAIRIARRYTGKFKILSAMRSYHGGTSGALGATGDFRTRFGTEQPGFVKVSSPHPLSFARGSTDEQAAAQCLMALEEQIITEGPQTIASIMLEPIMGPAGVLVQPVGYMEGVRALCDKYGILLHLDEVMTGFWRTGPLFAFMHFRGVVPDILTSSKGLTCSVLPIGMVGMRQKIMDYFETSPFGWGATWGNHPVLLAAAYEILRKRAASNIEARIAEIEEVMLAETECLVQKYPCIHQARVVGAFGCLDLADGLQDFSSWWWWPVCGKQSVNMEGMSLPKVAQVVSQSMRKHGLFALFRSPMMHIAPPHTITNEELKEMFRRIRLVLDDVQEEVHGK